MAQRVDGWRRPDRNRGFTVKQAGCPRADRRSQDVLPRTAVRTHGGCWKRRCGRGRKPVGCDRLPSAALPQVPGRSPDLRITRNRLPVPDIAVATAGSAAPDSPQRAYRCGGSAGITLAGAPASRFTPGRKSQGAPETGCTLETDTDGCQGPERWEGHGIRGGLRRAGSGRQKQPLSRVVQLVHRATVESLEQRCIEQRRQRTLPDFTARRQQRGQEHAPGSHVDTIHPGPPVRTDPAAASRVGAHGAAGCRRDSPRSGA